MPLWTIYHTLGIFKEEEKHQLASRITDHDERRRVARFCVITIFNETRPEDFYVGGASYPRGFASASTHARHSRHKESREEMTAGSRAYRKPYMEKHEGLHWEFHADETSEDLWMINGLVPPPGGSEIEKAWATANVASPY